jgi:hypothetical protein
VVQLPALQVSNPLQKTPSVHDVPESGEHVPSRFRTSQAWQSVRLPPPQFVSQQKPSMHSSLAHIRSRLQGSPLSSGPVQVAVLASQ